jgi:hypothetical protein
VEFVGPTLRSFLLASLMALACISASCAEEEKPGGPSPCNYGGAVRAVGEEFPCTDGCNRCRCLDGNSIESTTMFCGDSGQPAGDAGVSDSGTD